MQQKLPSDETEYPRMPRWIPVVICFYIVIGSFTLIKPEDTVITKAVVYGFYLLVLIAYFLIVLGKGWARWMLAALFFPVGITFLFSRKLKRYIRWRQEQIKQAV